MVNVVTINRPDIVALIEEDLLLERDIVCRRRQWRRSRHFDDAFDGDDGNDTAMKPPVTGLALLAMTLLVLRSRTRPFI